MNKKSTSNSNAVLEQMNDNPMPMNSNATKRALPVATERRVSKRVRKNVNCNTDNHNKDTNYELNDKNEEIVEAVAINNPKTNNENDSGINLSLTKNMHKTSIENNKQYELLSSSSDDNSSESSYILWGPKPVAENDVVCTKNTVFNNNYLIEMYELIWIDFFLLNAVRARYFRHFGHF